MISGKTMVVLAAAAMLGTAYPCHGAEELISNGDFSSLEGGSPKGWNLGESGVRVLGQGSNTRLFFERGGNAYITLPIEQHWEHVLVKAKISTRGIIPGQQSWQNARVIVTVENSDGSTTYLPSPFIDHDSDWVEIKEIATIPFDKSPIKLKINPGLFCDGTMEVDFVSAKLVPDGEKDALAAQIARERFEWLPEITPGKDIKVSWHPLPSNWKFSGGCSVNMTEKGAVMLLQNKDKSKSPIAIGTFRLSDRVETVRISAKVKLADVMVGENPSEQPRIFIDFRDADGNNVGGFPSINPDPASVDSQQVFESLAKPAGAVSIAVCPQLLRCEGSIEISDLAISAH